LLQLYYTSTLTKDSANIFTNSWSLKVTKSESKKLLSQLLFEHNIRHWNATGEFTNLVLIHEFQVNLREQVN